jgi:hypothetical protein
MREVNGLEILRMTQAQMKTTAKMKKSHMKTASEVGGMISASQPPDATS